jgi:hypothetical protein
MTRVSRRPSDGGRRQRSRLLCLLAIALAGWTSCNRTETFDARAIEAEYIKYLVDKDMAAHLKASQRLFAASAIRGQLEALQFLRKQQQRRLTLAETQAAQAALTPAQRHGAKEWITEWITLLKRQLARYDDDIRRREAELEALNDGGAIPERLRRELSPKLDWGGQR